MAILGFSGSPIEREGNVDRMVKAILAKSGKETEFVKLSRLNYMGCRGCAAKCAGKGICPIEDDLKPYFPKIRDAEAIVIGTAVNFNYMTSFLYSLLERFYCFRHVKMTIEGKPTILVVAGCMMVDDTVERTQGMLSLFGVNIIDTVKYVSQVPPCFVCGHHTECRIGGLYRMMGEAALSYKVTPESFHRWEDSLETRDAVGSAGQKLKELYAAYM